MPIEDFTDKTLAIGDTYGDDVREIVVLVMEVDKVADEVTDMEIDKQTDMVVNITNVIVLKEKKCCCEEVGIVKEVTKSKN